MAQLGSSMLAATFVVLLAVAPAVMCWTIKLDIKQGGQRVPVPASFLGLSLEADLDVYSRRLPTPHTLQVYANDAVFERLLSRLVDYNTGAMIVRFGGHSQNGDVVDPSAINKQRVWDSLMTLCDRLGHKIKYTIPLPLNLVMPITDLNKTLGSALNAFKDNPESIYAINIGNQPENQQQFMEDKYWNEVSRRIEALEPTISLFKGFKSRLFSGPSVGDIKTFTPDTVARLGEVGKGKPGGPYFKAVTLQYDGLTTDELPPDTARTRMLGQGEMEPVHILKSRYIDYTFAARAQGMEFRIDQMMSTKGAGIPGASDTMAGALYVIKTALTLLQHGVSGVNYHATGCGPTGPILFPMVCRDDFYVSPNAIDEKFKTTCPATCQARDALAEPNAPYYGMWFVQKLLLNYQNLSVVKDTDIEPSTEQDNPKYISVYAIASPKTLRIVIVNAKDAEGIDMVTVEVKGQEWGFGTVTMLQGEAGLKSTRNEIRLAGQRVTVDGKLEGTHRTCMVDRKFKSDESEQSTYYEVPMPAGSAAIMVIPDTTQLKGPKFDAWAKRGEEGLPDDVYKCTKAVGAL